MKYPCNLIKDILPLYHDQICSDETNRIVETHLHECTGCKAYYDQMCASDYLEDVIYDKSKSEQVAESYKKVKKKTAKKNSSYCSGSSVRCTGHIFTHYIADIGISDI